MAPPGSAPDPSSPRRSLPLPGAPAGAGAAPPLFDTGTQSAGARPPAAPLPARPTPRRARLSPKLTPCPASSHRHHLPPPPALKLPAHTTRGGAAPRPAGPRPAAASRSGGADHRGTSGERTGGGPPATHTPPRGRGTGQCASPPSPPCLVRPGRPRPLRGGRAGPQRRRQGAPRGARGCGAGLGGRVPRTVVTPGRCPQGGGDLRAVVAQEQW